eukprot:TRINITY_DN1096_c0_g1_i2.p1 TRINITY_DN1096_c0_g1~~TRINITY_DN1096_c0_g1_i2.p1  ORF type:complete len:182 (-),score=30.31 TRINITY_DN1096_c0_g1_i2:192-737(-)
MLVCLIRTCRSLTELNLAHLSLDRHHAMEMADALAFLPSLRSLSLFNAAVLPDAAGWGARLVAALHWNTRLHRLDVRNTAISSQEKKQIEALITCRAQRLARMFAFFLCGEAHESALSVLPRELQREVLGWVQRGLLEGYRAPPPDPYKRHFCGRTVEVVLVRRAGRWITYEATAFVDASD